MQGGHTEDKGTGKRKRRRGRARGEKPRTGTEDEAKENGPVGNTPTSPQQMMTSGVARQGEGVLTTAPAEGQGEEGGKLGYNPTPEDLRLREIYGYLVHANPGTHLDRGIGNDAVWKVWWRDLMVMLLRRYDAPSRKVGRRFVGTLGGELCRVRDRQWNSDRLLSSIW